MAGKLIAGGVRLSEEQWKMCDEMAERLQLRSRNEFIRDAVDFYTEWCQRPQSMKFLTPALESVIGAKVRDSENRIARMLFKMAVEQNCLSQMLVSISDFGEYDFDQCHLFAEQQVKETNGALSLKEKTEKKYNFGYNYDDDYED